MKFTLLIYISFSAGILYSQTEKGSFYIAGSSNASTSIQRGYSYTESNGLKKNDLISANSSLSLSSGYFVIDNFSVGLLASYQANRSYRGSVFNYFNTDKINFKSRTLSLGTELSYFFREGASWRPFLAPFSAMHWSRTNFALNTPSPALAKGKGLNVGLNMGLAYFINSNWSIYGGLRTIGYWSLSSISLTGEKPEFDEGFGKSNFRRVSMNAGFGIMLYF